VAERGINRAEELAARLAGAVEQQPRAQRQRRLTILDAGERGNPATQSRSAAACSGKEWSVAVASPSNSARARAARRAALAAAPSSSSALGSETTCPPPWAAASSSS
jgi:hypothetical protein